MIKMIMEQKYILESLLFTSGHPLSYKKIAEVSGFSEEEIEKSLKELAMDYEQNNRGLRLIFLDGKAQLVAAPESKEAMEKMIKSDFEEDLSQAALETLAIVAYKGPVSRAAVENLRGVNCSFILQSLAIRGLIDKKNNPGDGRSYIYNVTFDFLKHLGINKLDDLPNYNERK
ncbi:MAG: SMC-Scp complex subunit ScpB [Candidatus Azambacteria bacterium]|nr:SMC-Scp complex subunit ScpB [Candidatus Azambacteria bacterium]